MEKSELSYLLEALTESGRHSTPHIYHIRRAIERREQDREAQDTTWRNPEVAAKRAEQEHPADNAPKGAGDDDMENAPCVHAIAYDAQRELLREAVKMLQKIAVIYPQAHHYYDEICDFLKRMEKETK